MIKKVSIGKKLMDVIDEREYHKRAKLEDPLFEDTCVEKDGLLYPIQKKYDGTPGVYDAGPFLKFTKPVNDIEQYSSDKIIDFNNAKNFRDLISKQDDLRHEERAILSTVNNVFAPEVYDDDTPELVAIKQMITYKNIDPESYRHRFGDDFSNNMRPLKDKKNKSVSFYKVRTYCTVFDTKATLIIEDKEGAINPMGRRIEIEITSET